MKTLIAMAVVAMFTSNAQASFFMTECSNASGSVKTQGGHVANQIKIQTISTNGKKGTVTLSLADVEIKVEKEIAVSSKSEQHCDPNLPTKSGYASWQNIDVQEVTIIGRDGKKLPANASAGTGNGVIKTTLLCENNGNSQILCE